ncbi:MAG: hypothetical protein AAB688_01470 [Patescibacteria group bacterium]
MFGILVATIVGLLGYVFRQKNFYECYLSSTEFLLWWSVGVGILAFLLRRIAGGMPKRFCDIFHLSKLARRPFFRGELLFCFLALFSVGAAYLLHSSLGGLEGLRYWDSPRIVAGISMYCVIVFMNYVDFRKTESR